MVRSSAVTRRRAATEPSSAANAARAWRSSTTSAASSASPGAGSESSSERARPCSLHSRTAAGRPPSSASRSPIAAERAGAVGRAGPHLVAGEGPAVLIGDVQAAAHRPHGPAPVAGGVAHERLGLPRLQPRGGRAGRP